MEEDWSTVVNTKKIRNLERLEEKKKVRAEYEKFRLKQEMLEKGQESSSEEEDESITIGADFDELVRIHEKKEEETKKAKTKQQAAANVKNKQPKAKKAKKETAVVLANRIEESQWKEELESFSQKFSSNPTLQLKYLTDFFVDSFEPSSDPKPNSTVLNKKVLKLIVNWLTQFQEKEMNELPVFLFVAEQERPTPGASILLDLISRNFPSSFKSIPFTNMLSNKLGAGIMGNKMFDCLSQVIKSIIESNEPQIGLFLYLEYMTRTLGKGTNATLAENSISILESLIKKVRVNKPLSYSGSSKALKNILDTGNNSKYTDELKIKLSLTLRPLLKILRTDSDEGRDELFLTLLSSIVTKESNDTNPLMFFVLSILLNLISSDPDTYFKLLQTSYLNYVLQTNNLLHFLNENYGDDKVLDVKKLEKKEVKEGFFGLITYIQETNTTLRDNEAEVKKLQLNVKVLDVTSSTCTMLTSTLKGIKTSSSTLSSPVKKNSESVARNNSNSISFGRIVITLILVAIIYFIFVNDIQFSDIKDFVKEFKKQYLTQ